MPWGHSSGPGHAIECARSQSARRQPVTDALIDPKWPRWMAAHVRRYLASDGHDGHIWHDVPTLLLTTRGARSGRPRLVALIYGVDVADGVDRYVVVASHAGAPEHPHWYRNLLETAEADVQVVARRFRARGYTAEAAERDWLWALMVGIHPPYADYQQRTRRRIPVVVLEPTSS